MKAITGIFLETGLELLERKYRGGSPWIGHYIEACAMKLVLNPWQLEDHGIHQFVCDILSDWSRGW